MKAQKSIFEVENIIEFIIYIIIIIKILFLITTIGHLILSHTRKQTPKTKEFDEEFSAWREKFEFVFIVMMSCLLIFIFTPWADNTHYMTTTMKFLFYVFGFILILSADWNLVMPSTTLDSIIQKSLS